MTKTKSSDEDHFVSVPRGGPIYVNDMVGPLTKIPQFENSVYQELQSLKEELLGVSLEDFSEELTVDELKIISEDDLVKMAFEEAFKDGKLASGTTQATEEGSIPRTEDKTCGSGAGGPCVQESQNNVKAIVLSEASNALPLKMKKPRRNPPSAKSNQRKRGVEKNNSFDESYIANVERLARIKQKQEEQKATVRLHSFDGSRVPGLGKRSKADKIKSLKSACVSMKVRSSNPIDDILVHFPEVVLVVEVYHNRRTCFKIQEFMVLGCQFLTEVRDKIYCLTDEILKKAGKYDPSGYFLIEDVFYNDMRDPSSTDYSEPILNWLENSKDEALEKWVSIVSGELQQKQRSLLGGNTKHQLPVMRSFPMQNARFCDLNFRLGAGYLYCHQGDCKHSIVIRDMRLIHPEDVQSRSAYPLITYQPKLRYQKCSVCKIYRAQKVTVDDKWALSNPCYFCDICYYMLHYSEGTLLYDDFSVFDYNHE